MHVSAKQGFRQDDSGVTQAHYIYFALNRSAHWDCAVLCFTAVLCEDSQRASSLRVQIDKDVGSCSHEPAE